METQIWWVGDRGFYVVDISLDNYQVETQIWWVGDKGFYTVDISLETFPMEINGAK